MGAIADINVLVIEDSEPMRALLRRMLFAAGFRHIREAASAESGWDALKAPTDLMLLDWRMAEMDGIAFARKVRRESEHPYVPIVMLTAHTEASRVAAARDAGVTGFVKKPVSTRLLFARISSALTDARLFIDSADFVGPDRRRGQAASYAGPFRRESDLETIDIDDLLRCA